VVGQSLETDLYVQIFVPEKLPQNEKNIGTVKKLEKEENSILYIFNYNTFTVHGQLPYWYGTVPY